MKEISLHIMDIVQNSITAGASLIEVELSVSHAQNLLSVSIKDNGKGMSSEMLAQVQSPFVTTRTTRKVGFGISLFQAGATATDGFFEIDSTLGEGTLVRASYVLDHIDRPPIGDFAGTMHVLITGNPDLDFVVCFSLEGTVEKLDTREIREVLGSEVPLNTPDVSLWMKENLDEMFSAELSTM